MQPLGATGDDRDDGGLSRPDGGQGGSTRVPSDAFTSGSGGVAVLMDRCSDQVLDLECRTACQGQRSPAGSVKRSSPAGAHLEAHGVEPAEFNSYGARRGNHEVMMRGTFANIRLRNQLAPGTEGGVTVHLSQSDPTATPTAEQMSIYDAAMHNQAEDVPLIVLAGTEYGSGSSRDWAAKGPALLGVRAVIARSYERIHRSNLIGMGILPLQFSDGDSVESLGLTGHETYDIAIPDPIPDEVTVRAGDTQFRARVRIDTPREADYYRHGGILQYVLRQLCNR